jgi:hypothetical protein
MNSDELSRELDNAAGLEDYVRLSFNDKNPMQFIVLQEKRASNLVMLQVELQVVSRPGVLFSDCNATRKDAVKSASPDVVHFNVVKAKDHFEVKDELRHLYQAEVLVPSPVPPHLIVFPTSRQAAEDPARPSVVDHCGPPKVSERGEKNALVSRSLHKNTASVHRHKNLDVHANKTTCGAMSPLCAPDTRTCERTAVPQVPAESKESARKTTVVSAEGLVVPSSAANLVPERTKAEEADQCPVMSRSAKKNEPLTTPVRRRWCTHARDLNEAKRIHAAKLELCFERFVALSSPSGACKSPSDPTAKHDLASSDVRCKDCSNLFPFRSCSNSCHAVITNPTTTQRVTKVCAAEARPLRSVIRVGCEMPLSDNKNKCEDCMLVGPFQNCSRHMTLCNAEDIWISCENCQRVLCSRHYANCYCIVRLKEPRFSGYRLSYLTEHAAPQPPGVAGKQ